MFSNTVPELFLSSPSKFSRSQPQRPLLGLTPRNHSTARPCPSPRKQLRGTELKLHHSAIRPRDHRQLSSVAASTRSFTPNDHGRPPAVLFIAPVAATIANSLWQCANTQRRWLVHPANPESRFLACLCPVGLVPSQGSLSLPSSRAYLHNHSVPPGCASAINTTSQPPRRRYRSSVF